MFAVRALIALTSHTLQQLGVDVLTGAPWSRLAADDGAGAPLAPTATTGAGGKVGLDVHVAGLPSALGPAAAGFAVPVVVANAGAPGHGSFLAPNTTGAPLRAAGVTYPLGMTLYPDPNIDVYVSMVAGFTVPAGPGTSTTIRRLAAGGAPITFAGPIDPNTIYVGSISGAPCVDWTGQ